MNSATKAQEYEKQINKDHTLGYNNCDNVRGDNAFMLNRMKVSSEIRRSQNPLDMAQNIRGYDAQGNKILINQEAIQSGFLSDQGTNFELVGNHKKSVNRMFERQFENQAVFLNQNYNPHINQIRPNDPRHENLIEKDELKREYTHMQSPQSVQSIQSMSMQQGPSSPSGQSGKPTCPYCNSTKYNPFTNDGGSVLICLGCQKTYNNIYYNPSNPLAGGNPSPWFSDQYKKMNDQKNQPQVPQWTPIKTTGMRGEGNWKPEYSTTSSAPQNVYANHANNQLMSYRSKFDLDHKGF